MSPVIFWKENAGIIGKMFVNQIGMTIFGLLLALATAMVSGTLLLLSSLFAIGFYMCLLYMMSWDYGARDKIRVDGGRMAYFPYKGVLLSLYANLLNILLAVLAIVGYFCTSNFEEGIPAWAANLWFISNSAARFLQAMYLGFIKVAFPDDNPFALLLIVVPALFFCGLGYMLGLKNRRIFGFAAPKPGNADEKAEYPEHNRPQMK